MDRSEFDRHVLHTYRRFPLTLVRGEGMRVWDDQGTEYLDFFPGWGAGNLGHCHPAVVAAIRSQAERILHIPNVYYNQPQGELAGRIIDHAFDGQVFFCNSGAEANEGAFKLARKRRADKKKIITLIDSFHGRTLATLTATGQSDYQQGFDPLPAGFEYCPANDAGRLAELMDDSTAALLLEPVLGEGGVRPLTTGFMQAARELCDRHDALLMLDEVQTGIGRTGKMFAFQHHGIVPDVLTLAKSLGGGVAIGAFVVARAHCQVLGPGSHGSTFGGNPLACSAGIAVIDTIVRERLLEQASATGAWFGDRLQEMKSRHGMIKEVRGVGMMWGVELDRPGAAIVDRCREQRLLINCTHQTVLRLMPAINAARQELDRALQILEGVLASPAAAS